MADVAIQIGSNDEPEDQGVGLSDVPLVAAEPAQAEQEEKKRFIPPHYEDLGPMSAQVRKQFEAQLENVEANEAEKMFKTMDEREKMMRQNPGDALISLVKKRVLFWVKMLIEEYSANINHADKDGNTPLHWAAWFERPEIVTYLVDKGADCTAKNKKGQTALHWSSMSGVITCLKPILSGGGDMAATDEDGFTVAHCSAQHGKTAALDWLQMKGADVHLLDMKGRNPLHWAAYKDSVITSNWLIRQGVAMYVQDVGGRLPIHWACSKNNVSVVQLLVEEMQQLGDYSCLEVKDGDGFTPIMLAEQRESFKTLSYLSRFDRRRKSRRQYFMDRLTCNADSSGNRMDSARTAGVKIQTWYFVTIALTFLEYIMMVYPAASFPRDVLAQGIHIWCILGFIVCTGMYITVHRMDPGYIPKADEATRKAVARAPKTESGSSNLLASDQLQMDQEDNSYERCLEEGRIEEICVSCRIMKPLRSKHCRSCDACVVQFDHHCPWINNCVGKRNHRLFTAFLFTMTLSMMVYFSVHCAYFTIEANRTPGAFALAIPLMLHALIMSVYCFAMWAQQFGMMLGNLTTNERINAWRYQYLKNDKGKFANPFSRGPCMNMLTFWGCVAPKAVEITYNNPNDPTNSDIMDPSFVPDPMGQNSNHGHSHGGHNSNRGHAHAGKECRHAH